MKTFWNILAAVAVLNLLAFGGLLGYLGLTHRLSRERVVAVRTHFVKTIPEEQQEQAAVDAEAKAKADIAAAAAKMAIPPKTAADRIADEQFRQEQRSQIELRRQQELESMQASVMAQLARLEEREKKLEQDRKVFAEERRRLADGDHAAQFKQALATLEDQKPKDAKQVLKALLDAKQVDQVVAYLAKMEDSKRAKVMAEFVREDAAVAADLLERLRTRGLSPPPPTQPDPAKASANDSNSTPTALAGTPGP